MATRFLPEVNRPDSSKTAPLVWWKLTCRPADTFSALCADTSHPQPRYTGNQSLPLPTRVFPPSEHADYRKWPRRGCSDTAERWHCRPAVCSAGKMTSANLPQHKYPCYKQKQRFPHKQFVVLWPMPNTTQACVAVRERYSAALQRSCSPSRRHTPAGHAASSFYTLPTSSLPSGFIMYQFVMLHHLITATKRIPARCFLLCEMTASLQQQSASNNLPEQHWTAGAA